MRGGGEARKERGKEKRNGRGGAGKKKLERNKSKE